MTERVIFHCDAPGCLETATPETFRNQERQWSRRFLEIRDTPTDRSRVVALLGPWAVVREDGRGWAHVEMHACHSHGPEVTALTHHLQRDVESMRQSGLGEFMARAASSGDRRLMTMADAFYASSGKRG